MRTYKLQSEAFVFELTTLRPAMARQLRCMASEGDGRAFIFEGKLVVTRVRDGPRRRRIKVNAS